MKTATKRTLDKLEIVREVDVSPDTSWLGEYSSNPGPADRTIDRQERGDMGRCEYRYFIAANSGKDTGNPNSVDEDYKRMEEINNGSICFYGVRVRATIAVHHDKHVRLFDIESPGLWGIESDSEESYFREVGAEELETIRPELEDLGVDPTTIDDIADVPIVDK